MATLRWPRRSTWTDRRFAVGDTDEGEPFTAIKDEKVELQDDNVIDHYLERGWKRVDDPDGGSDDTPDPDDGGADDDDVGDDDVDDAETVGEDEGEADSDDDADDGDAVDLDAFLEKNVPDVKSAIEAGDWDDNLEEIDDLDDRKGVQDAVKSRQDELSG